LEAGIGLVAWRMGM